MPVEDSLWVHQLFNLAPESERVLKSKKSMIMLQQMSFQSQAIYTLSSMEHDTMGCLKSICSLMFFYHHLKLPRCFSIVSESSHIKQEQKKHSNSQ